MTLAANDLSCAHGGRVVVSGITLELRAGEVLGVLGANGAGKSTLLATLAGELPAAGGRLAFDGRALAHWSARDLARRRAVLTQSAALGFDLGVETVVGMGAYPFDTLAPAQRDALVARALELADCALLRGRRALTLSGGEQQRVQFARVLVQLLAARTPGEYRVLLLDEPTASLDPRHQHALLRVVRALAREEHLAAAVVLHDVNLAARWCDRVLLLADGRSVALGSPADVFDEARLARIYGLPARVVVHPARRGQPLVLFDGDEAVGGD